MDGSAATITAAAIGGAIALVGLVANKENKTSEFRQQWIDVLRNDIAALVGTLYVIQGGAKDSSKAAETVNSLNCRIHLRFKYADPKSYAFQKALSRAMSLDTLHSTPDSFKGTVDTLVNEAQMLLREEWLIVKRGERVYRWFIRALVALLIVFTVGACLILWHGRIQRTVPNGQPKSPLTPRNLGSEIKLR